jgi:hypothetical protein
MTRAYRPRASTVDLIRRIGVLDGVERVHSIAPSRGSGRPAGLRVYLTPRREGDRTYTDFTLPEARAWLETEEAGR